MASRWMKLDTRFFEDEKVENLISHNRNGKALAFEWLQLVCLSYESSVETRLGARGDPAVVYGALDVKDPDTLRRIEKHAEISPRRLPAVIEKCVDEGLFSREHYERFGIVTSERMMAQGESMARSIEQKRAAGRASAESRRSASSERDG